MSISLYAQPYDLSATCFYFCSAEEFKAKSSALKNIHGDQVEEFEIQFIDGSDLDHAFAKAFSLYQSNISAFFEIIERWEDWQKICFIIAVGECGYSYDVNTLGPNDYDVDIYAETSLRELVEQFVQEGLYGDIPAPLASYIDYEAIARDLSVDYSETIIAGIQYTYRCS